MPEGRRPLALITGASGGIGEELAREFAGGGHDLVLVARTTSKLQALGEALTKAHGTKAEVISADLADPEAPAKVLAATRAKKLEVDVLVNNAGFGLVGSFARLDLKKQLEMITVNVAALTHLTGLYLPGMLERRSGRILNVASTAAYLPGPKMAVYYASKAYVLSLSVALADELKGSGVTVTALCPGPTRTGFGVAAGATNTRLFKQPAVMDTPAVARAGFRAAMRGRTIVVPGMINKLGVLSSALAPKKISARIAAALQSEG